MMVGCGGDGGGSLPVDNIPIDNAPHIIQFSQPDEYIDGAKMSVPSVIGGYYLYICHVDNGKLIDNMVWIAEISTDVKPLNYDNNAWRGEWDIFNLLKSEELSGIRADDTHAFALKAVSRFTDQAGKPEVSVFSAPWVYGANPYQVDDIQIPIEGDPYAKHPVNPLSVQPSADNGSK